MIKIAYLAYDLMNLYGDSGNVKILKEKLGDEAEIVNIPLGADVAFSAYDFIYMGAGTEKALLLVLDWLMPYKEKLIKAINSRTVLFTGNAYQILGNNIIVNGEKIEAIAMFNFDTVVSSDKRVMKDMVLKSEYFENEVIGFLNTAATVDHERHKLFQIQENYGMMYKDFIAANLTGPFLVKNPEVLKFVLKKLSNKEFDLELEYKAYNMALNQLKKK